MMHTVSNVSVGVQVDQLDQQVRPDGLHVEGVITYHLATHRIFHETPLLANQNNITDTTAFPLWFMERLQDMGRAVEVLSLPNGDSVQFGDQGVRMRAAQIMHNKEHAWVTNKYQYKKKKIVISKPRSQRLKYSGYYSIRSNHTAQASALILRCGPSGNAHMHKDAGSFEFAVGRNLILSDSGAYTYRGMSV